jgi:hypothetical protein
VTLFRRRPEVVRGAPPRDLTDLAARLVHPQALLLAFSDRSLPCFQLAEAAQALGDGCTRADLADLLESSGPGHRAFVEEVVDELVAAAVLAVDDDGLIDDGLIRVPPSFADLFPRPLGLGTPAAVLLGKSTVDGMRRILTGLGLPPQTNRGDVIDTLLGFYRAPDSIRAVLSAIPSEFVDYLTSLATPEGLTDSGEADGPPGNWPPRGYYTDSYELRVTASQWASDLGLMLAGPYAPFGELPAEVSRVLRGPAYRAPFSPRPPHLAVHKVDVGRVESDSAAAAAQFADQLLAVLDRIVRVPVPWLKSGGVGSRDLAKLGKTLGIDPLAVRLVLELADAIGLLAKRGLTITVSDAFTEWRESEPAFRFLMVLSAWWELGANPTQDRDAEGKALRALARLGTSDMFRRARRQVLATIAALDGGTTSESLASTVAWQRPLGRFFDDAEFPLAAVWREAEAVGVIAQGAITSLGRLLLSGDDDPSCGAGWPELHTHLTGLLPASADHATFGADLSVYVVGAPSARVSALLDSAADRESQGGAVTWRFTTASVRRALDEGMAAEALAAALAEIATGELPQPLRYLIADLGRRHGSLRVAPATSCIRSDDVTLLAEVAADRALTKHGIRLLAPTVLVSSTPADELLLALRAAGYLPLPDVPDTALSTATGDGQNNPLRGDPGNAVLGNPVPSNVVPLVKRRLTPVPRGPVLGLNAAPTLPDLQALAHRLLTTPVDSTPRGVATARVAAIEGMLAAHSRSLSPFEVQTLAQAISDQRRIVIDYESTDGNLTTRVISRIELSEGNLYAWCELRHDERTFAVAGVRSVLPV